MALHDARLLELSAAAWQAVACQGPPPPPPATTSGGGAAQQHLRCCQVCAINLAGSPSYFQRIRACKEHVSATSVQLNGGVQRFCQQCSRFHAVESFDGMFRSCRQQLARHAERRRMLRRARKGQPAAAAAGQQVARRQELRDVEHCWQPAKRQRAAAAEGAAPQLNPRLELPLLLPPGPTLPAAGMHSSGLQPLPLDRVASCISCDSQLVLPTAASGGAAGGMDTTLAAALAAAAPSVGHCQPDAQGAPQLSVLRLLLAAQQRMGAGPVLPMHSDQQLMLQLSTLLVRRQQARQQQAQQLANVAALVETLQQSQAAPLPAPSLQGRQSGSAFMPFLPLAAPAISGPTLPPAPAAAWPKLLQPAPAPVAKQALATFLALLLASGPLPKPHT